MFTKLLRLEWTRQAIHGWLTDMPLCLWRVCGKRCGQFMAVGTITEHQQPMTERAKKNVPMPFGAFVILRRIELGRFPSLDVERAESAT
jgi:hypothetical protein